MANQILMSYGTSWALGTTNLQSLGTSSTYVAGWQSGSIDNSSDKYTDYRITAKMNVGTASLAAGEIRMYLVGMYDDTSWPDTFTGTDATVTVTDTEIRDAICNIAAVTTTDTTNSRVYYLECPSVASVFGGNQPSKFQIFVSQSTGQALWGTGNTITIKPSYGTIA